MWSGTEGNRGLLGMFHVTFSHEISRILNQFGYLFGVGPFHSFHLFPMYIGGIYFEL